MKIRKPYDSHERTPLKFIGVSLTKQAMKSESDINNIMAKYAKTGIISHLSNHQGQYGDFSEVTDYHTALNQMIEAESSFASLPSGVRAEFDNNPGKFLDFVHDPANEEKMIEMGLAYAPDPPPEVIPSKPKEPIPPAPKKPTS